MGYGGAGTSNFSLITLSAPAGRGGGREQVVPESTQKKVCCSLNSRAERRVESERLKFFAPFGVFICFIY